jgi:hypothetical protein
MLTLPAVSTITFFEGDIKKVNDKIKSKVNEIL